MNVYAYTRNADSLAADPNVQLWASEWSRAGFAPRVLFESDARLYPDFARLDRAFSPYPNRPAFDRWLALRVAATRHPPGRALLFADFTVRNTGARPGSVPAYAVESTGVAVVRGADAFLATITGLNRALAAFGDASLALRIAKSGDFTPSAFLSASVHRPTTVVLDGVFSGCLQPEETAH